MYESLLALAPEFVERSYLLDLLDDFHRDPGLAKGEAIDPSPLFGLGLVICPAGNESVAGISSQ